MRKCIFILFLFPILIACKHKVAYLPLTAFTVDNLKIENLDKVSLIYTSETPLDEPKLSYFIQTIAINERTKDTLNLLTIFNRGGGKGYLKNEFKFFSLDSEEGQTYFNKLFNTNGETHTIDEINKIDRVVYDKRFKFIANTKYPAVIGFIEK